jgi:hypothetical protein
MFWKECSRNSSASGSVRIYKDGSAECFGKDVQGIVLPLDRKGYVRMVVQSVLERMCQE